MSSMKYCTEVRVMSEGGFKVWIKIKKKEEELEIQKCC